MEESIKPKTGKSLKEWIAILKPLGFQKHGEYLAYLKGEHGVTHGYANLIAHKARGSDAGSHDEDDLIVAQYSKGKEHLKELYDVLVEQISSFGEDIEFAPKKANVSVRRKRQFVLIQPSTKSRMDLGLKLPGVELSGRLEGSGPFGTMCTHRVRLETLADIDTEVISWIRNAYELAG